MNPILKQLTALAAVLAFGVSALASESKTTATELALSPSPNSWLAPSIMRQSTPMNAAELEKYRNLAAQSHDLAASTTAGASDTTKTILIVVAVVGVVAAVAYNNSAASGIGPINVGPM